MNHSRQITRAAFVTACLALCFAANAVGVLRKEVLWHEHRAVSQDVYVHGWPFAFMHRSTMLVDPKRYLPRASVFASRLPLDCARIAQFSWPLLAADAAITSTIGLVAVALVYAASYYPISTERRISLWWTFLVVTAIIGVFLTAHGEHADWVFFRWHALIPFDDLAMSVVICIGLIHLPTACRKQDRIRREWQQEGRRIGTFQGRRVHRQYSLQRDLA